MKRHRFIVVHILMCMALLACGILPSMLQSTGTPTMTATILPTETITPTRVPPTATLVPTPAPPAIPANLKVEIISCIPLHYCTFNNPAVCGYAVTIRITWEDKSNNEEGFIIYKDNVEYKNVDANTTEFKDYFEFPLSQRFQLTGAVYSIQAYNDAGRSGRVTKTIAYSYKCK